MTPALISLTSNLYAYLCQIYGEKFVKAYHTESFVKRWINEWADGLLGIDPKIIKKAMHHCKTSLEWPPSLPELIGICDRISGLPSFYDVIRLAAALNRDREFDGRTKDSEYHPVVRLALDKIGSWSMRQDTEEVLAKKFKTIYEEALTTWRMERNTRAKQLEAPTNVLPIKTLT